MTDGTFFPVMDDDEECGTVYPVHNGWHAMAADLHGMSGGIGWHTVNNAYSTREHAETAVRDYWRNKKRGA